MLLSLDMLKMQYFVCVYSSGLNIAKVYYQDVFRRLEASSEIVSLQLVHHIFVLRVENLTLFYLIGNYAE